MTNKEIERKFLVRDRSVLQGRPGVPIMQGYPIKEHGHMTMRVRIIGEHAFLTLKSPVNGLTRDEFEYSIPLADARTLIECHCDHRVIRKTRYDVPYRGQRFDVDVFEGVHQGLVVAELELAHEAQRILRPDWLGDEVSHDRRYGNFSLALAEQARAQGVMPLPRPDERAA